jgi:hypothetical protein
MANSVGTPDLGVLVKGQVDNLMEEFPKDLRYLGSLGKHPNAPGQWFQLAQETGVQGGNAVVLNPAENTLDLRVSLIAKDDNIETIAVHLTRCFLSATDEGAGGVRNIQTAGGERRENFRADAVCAGNHERATDVVKGADRSDTFSFEPVEDTLVVYHRTERLNTTGLRGLAS